MSARCRSSRRRAAASSAPAHGAREGSASTSRSPCGALGASYDLTGNGHTAIKASYSRYGLQVGIDRVTNVNPFSNGSRDCPWTDPNGDGNFQDVGSDVAQCSAFSGGVGLPTTLTASSGRTRTRPRLASKPSCRATSASARCSTTAPIASSSGSATGRADVGLHAVHAEHPERPRRLARQPGADDGDRLQHPGRRPPA